MIFFVDDFFEGLIVVLTSRIPKYFIDMACLETAFSNRIVFVIHKEHVLVIYGDCSNRLIGGNTIDCSFVEATEIDVSYFFIIVEIQLVAGQVEL